MSAMNWNKPHPESLWVKPHPLQQKPLLTVSAAPQAGQLPADWTDFSPASTLSHRVHEPLTGTDMQRTLRAELLYLTADRVNFFLLDGFLKHRAVILTVVNAWPTQFKCLFQVVCGSLLLLFL